VATEGRRRALGQHFLRDASIAQAIASAILEESVQKKCTRLMEIGPGKGAITLPLLNHFSQKNEGSLIEKILLVERDPQLAMKWKESPQPGGVHLETEMADFLELSEERWLGDGGLGVVSNLPYSSGTAILTRLAKHFNKISVMVLMFQAEVAQRLRAEASTSHRGSLSLWVQNRWDVRKLLAVPPRAFQPPPQVQSEVVLLVPREKPWIQISPAEERVWEIFLKTAFAHRRKMLRSILPWRNALALADVDGTKRAEALQWQEWDRLFQAVKKTSQSD
jgi:16S rRNA (adenine1518-N6/adenine1519-N6)-dimethyltransferase